MITRVLGTDVLRGGAKDASSDFVVSPAKSNKDAGRGAALSRRRLGHSPSGMRQRSSDNSGGCETKDSILESRLFKKSASMESRPTPCSTSSDSIKSSIPVRTPTMPIAPSVYTSDRSNTISPKEIKVISKAKSRSIVDPKTLKLRATVLVDGTVPCSHVEGATATSPNQREAENNENNSTGIRQRSSPVSPVRPKEEEVVQCSPTTMMHPAGTQPKPATSGVAMPSTRVSSKMTTTTISGRSSNKSDAKTMQSKTKAAKNNTVEKIAEKDEQPSKRLANEEPRRTNDLIKKVERSFIPLMTSIPRRNDVRSLRRSTKNSKAPLAEFESSRIENSPAVELPPLSFDRISNSPNRRCRLAMRAEDGPATIAEESIVTVTESFSNTAVQNNVVPVSREDWNGNIEVTVARTTISEDSQASCWPLTSPAASSAETNRGLIDDEIK
ncbi:unnamed protein product [Toxocara canis]|uniref:Flocculation protein FLO11-like n=1 Tax=Toxocara canis TaxID=6265 RepID=A0A183UZ89_TOXCA|nr:unnamed protein product [Toxocara canis]